MTAVEQYQPRTEIMPMSDPTGGRLVAWAQAAGAANQLAKALVQTGFVPMVGPKNNRRPMSENDVTATILMGDELGFSPLAALRSLYVVHGTPALYSRSMVALALSRGHQVWTEESGPTQVVVCGRRLGSEHVERAVWTMDRARKAGYTSNTKYSETPEEMLYAKAAAEIARKIAPDVLSGVPYSVEDLELEPENQPTARVARSTATRAVRRQDPPAVPEPEFDEPVPEPVKATAERADEPITPKQLTALNAALSQDLGFTDRDDKLAYLSGELGREIASSKDVTKSEAGRLLDGFAAALETTEPTLPGGAV
jgi:hypothetical protein